MPELIPVGLRIDVDTLRGTRQGVPALLRVLSARALLGTFFFSVGPDNMGRHLWRLLRPAFLLKMLRTDAPSLYGWDILLRGTLWPGPNIAQACAAQILAADQAGHEIGIHAWDHHLWQNRCGRMGEAEAAAQTGRAAEALTAILGRDADCAAAPGWRATAATIRSRARLPLRYGADCRGRSIFRPAIQGEVFSLPQIPSTLPTYDELAGPDCSDLEYNQRLLDRIRPGALNVLTVHAEVEGVARIALFESFLDQARRRGLSFVPLGELLSRTGSIPACALDMGRVPGREGWVAVQGDEVKA